MIASSGKTLRCIVVTPERAVLDETVEFVALPMFDGEVGVLPGRAPLIGRLGHGEMRLTLAGPAGTREVVHGGTSGELRTEGSHRYQSFFVDGGFAQIRSNVVTVLTDRAIAAAEIDRQAAAQQLTTALAQIPKSPSEQVARDKDEMRARALLHISGKQQAS